MLHLGNTDLDIQSMPTYPEFYVHVTNKGVSTIEATEAAASVIFQANSYMYSQLSTLHRVDYNAYSVTLTWFSVHSE